MIARVLLNFQDSEPPTWVEIDPIKTSIELEEQIHNNLKPTVSTLKFRFRASSALINALMASTEDILVVAENAEEQPVFTGSVRRDYAVIQSGKSDELVELQCVDNTYLLKKILRHPLFEQGKTVTYLVGALLQLAGVDAAYWPPEEITTEVAFFTVKADGKTTVEDILATLLVEHGFVYYTTGDGVFHLIAVVDDTPAASYTFSDANINRGWPIVRREVEIDSVEIRYPMLELRNKAIVFDDTTGGNQFYSMFVSLAPGEFYPKGASDSDKVWASYAIQDADLVFVASPSLEWSGETGIELVRASFESTRADIAYKNTGGVPVELKKHRIRGNAVVKTGEGIARGDDGSTDHPDRIDAKYLSDTSIAQNLAQQRYKFLKNSRIVYSLKSPDLCSPGDVVRVTYSKLGLDVKGRIVRRRYTGLVPNWFEYLIEPLGGYTAGVTLADPEYTAPGPKPGSPTAPDIYDAINGGFESPDLGTTLIPEVPIVEATGLFRGIVLRFDKQQTLGSAFAGYEVQVSDDASTWYSLQFDLVDWKDTENELTSWPVELVSHPVPHAGDVDTPAGRTLHYRVRRVTKQNLRSDWAFVTATSLTVETGDIAANAITANKLVAGVLNALIAQIADYLTVGGDGLVGTSSDGAWRVVFTANEITFQTLKADVWVAAGWIGDSAGGLASVFAFLKGLIAPGVVISTFGIGIIAPTGARLFPLNDDFDDQGGSDPWTTKDNLAFDASDKKFGTHSLESGGTTGTLAWASAIDTNSAFHIDGYVKHDFSAPTETGAVLKIAGLDISKLFDSGTKVQASDGVSFDSFGNSVAISGDYAVIGASADDSNKGSAYVFERIAGTWTQVQKLTASDGATGDRFGFSVAISGDYAVIGAYEDDDNGSNSGSAYVFERISGTWTQTQKLTASDGATGDWFGYSVAISGDYAVIGAYEDDDNGSASGSAYVFERISGTWAQVQKLTASDGAVGDFFGYSVAISGDYAVIGASADDSNKGSAYVFERIAGTWTQVQKLTASDGATGDRFGYSVDISGNDIVIGAYGDDDNGSSSGSAYVFERISGTWAQVQKLTASDGAVGDFFGYSVAISGDYAVIGAHEDDDNGSASGSAYVFERISGTWTQTQKLTASDGATDDNFGRSVAISDDFVLSGASGETSNRGAGYFFIAPGDINGEQLTLYAQDGPRLTGDVSVPVKFQHWTATPAPPSGDYPIVVTYHTSQGEPGLRTNLLTALTTSGLFTEVSNTAGEVVVQCVHPGPVQVPSAGTTSFTPSRVSDGASVNISPTVLAQIGSDYAVHWLYLANSWALGLFADGDYASSLPVATDEWTLFALMRTGDNYLLRVDADSVNTDATGLGGSGVTITFTLEASGDVHIDELLWLQGTMDSELLADYQSAGIPWSEGIDYQKDLIIAPKPGGVVHIFEQVDFKKVPTVNNVPLTSPPVLHVQHQTASGVGGGTFTAGAWRTRPLTTEVLNEISGASVASNQITLPAGKYELEAWASSYLTRHNQTRWHNVTDDEMVLLGITSYSFNDTTAAASNAQVRGVFTLAGTKTFELQHRCVTTSADNGMGVQADWGINVQADVFIKKIG